MFLRKYSPIGLDLGSSAIKAVQLRRTRSTTTLAAALCLPREPGSAMTVDALTRLGAAMKRQGFIGNRVVIACPPEQLISNILELPPVVSGAPIQRLAAAEVQRLGRLEGKPFEMAYWPLPASVRSPGTTSVMTVAAPESSTEPVAQMLEDAGFEPIAIDAHACALARACQQNCAEGISVIAELGASVSTIVLARETTVLHQRTVPEAGLNILHRSINDALHLDEAETDGVLREVGLAPNDGPDPLTAKEIRLRNLVLQHIDQVAREIETSIAFAAHRYPGLRLSGVLLAGGGAQVPNLRNELAQRVQLAVTPVNAMALGMSAPGMDEYAQQQQLVAAIGLALSPCG